MSLYHKFNKNYPSIKNIKVDEKGVLHLLSGHQAKPVDQMEYQTVSLKHVLQK